MVGTHGKNTTVGNLSQSLPWAVPWAWMISSMLRFMRHSYWFFPSLQLASLANSCPRTAVSKDRNKGEQGLSPTQALTSQDTYPRAP